MTTRRLHFIGNVLPTTAASEQHPEAGVNSFHITESESNQMDLTGLPLHLEHDDKLPVGTIQKQFTDKSGKKWIIGEIHDDSIAAKFAGKDLESNAAMFKGLSLQHVHSEYSDGTSSKRPVEVSLCKDPRRPGCGVAVVRSVTEKCKYKSPYGIEDEPMSANEEPKTQQPVETPTEPEKKPEMESKNEEVEKTELMKQVLDYHQRLEDESGKATELKKELDALRAANEAREAKQREEQAGYIKKLADSVMEQVVQLSPEYKDKETTDAIDMLAKDHPEQIKRVLEIAHCASKRNQELELELKRQKDDHEKQLLEARYNDTVKRKAGVHNVEEPAATTTVSASKRSRTNPYASGESTARKYSISDNINMDHAEDIRSAYHSLRGKGSMMDCMKDVSGIIGTQRKNGFR